jgi:hypothetical protein
MGFTVIFSYLLLTFKPNLIELLTMNPAFTYALEANYNRHFTKAFLFSFALKDL